LLDAAEQRTTEEKARRAEEKRSYEEEIVRVTEEGKRRVEEVNKMAQEIAQRVKDAARSHVEEVKRVREEGNRRVQEVSGMAEEITRQVREEATRRAEERRIHNEELEKIKEEGNRREEEIFKRTEAATKKAQEAIATANAGKEEAVRQSANLMEEAEEKIRRAIEKAMTRMDPRKQNLTERQYKIIRNSEEPNSDVDAEAVQNSFAGPSNRAIHEPSRDMNRRGGVVQKVTFSNFHGFYWLIVLLPKMPPVQTSRIHFEAMTRMDSRKQNLTERQYNIVRNSEEPNSDVDAEAVQNSFAGPSNRAIHEPSRDMNRRGGVVQKVTFF
jgi:hypothetical protein